MNSLNQVAIEGNICFDPELKKTPSGTSVCTLTIAVNRTYKNSKKEPVNEVSFVSIETFGNLAENCYKFCPKGRLIQVLGHLKQSRWEDDKGTKHSKLYVMAEHIEFKTRPKNKDNQQRTVSMISETALAAVQELSKDSLEEDEIAF